MDRFEAMALLVEVVDEGSLSAASRSLRTPLATVSRKITELESLLGTKLLIRTTRSLKLTDAGAVYVSAARRILEELEAVEREAAGEMIVPKGELVITAPVMFGRLHVVPIVTQFLSEFPEIDVHLRLGDQNAQLVDDHIDMAVRIGALSDSAMIATRVGAMRTLICASPRFLDAHGRPQQPSDIATYQSIVNDTPMNAAGWAFMVGKSAKPVAFPCRPRLTVTTSDAALEAAKEHAGLVRLLHYQAIDAIEAGVLEVVLQPYEPPLVDVHILHVARGRLPLKMRSFLTYVVPRLRKRLERFSS